MHDEMTAQCKEFFDDFKHHKQESTLYREKAIKNESQLNTLKESQERIMNDIEMIKVKVEKVDNNVTGLKVWILMNAVAVLVILLGQAVYFGNKFSQIDTDSIRIGDLERIHPRAGGKVVSAGD